MMMSRIGYRLEEVFRGFEEYDEGVWAEAQEGEKRVLGGSAEGRRSKRKWGCDGRKD